MGELDESAVSDALDFLESLVMAKGKPRKEAAAQVARFVDDPRVVKEALRRFDEKTGRIRTLKEPEGLFGEELESWYIGPQPADRCWPALRRYLEEKSWPEDTVRSIDDASSKIVGCLTPPGAGRIESRGLVLGYVQSGKTANYTAVIAKAADVGYKFFVVLAGIHNSLRAQTQRRLDKELVHLNDELWFQLTTEDGDFRQRGNASAFLTTRVEHRTKVLCVVKKNATVLRRFLRWLRTAKDNVLRKCPVLIIDDEADQATVNTHRDPELRTAINGLLVDLLTLLPKAAYVGYTATPFANVFIDPSMPQDLYPRDFIIDLPRPKAYFGPERIFGRDRLSQDEADEETDGLDILRTIPDHELPALKPQRRSEKGDFDPSLTPTLKEALRYFWLATSARAARGQGNQHSTMLIHTTVYTEIHGRFLPTVESYRTKLFDQVAERDPVVLEELRTLWEREMDAIDYEQLSSTEPVSFGTLVEHLCDTLYRSETIQDNSSSTRRLDYSEEGCVFIVVGGNTLSRGLTLEGLTVSFFVRAASAYDTLLQMGRWFGYRIGYEDLPRVWMTLDLQRNFYDLATVEREIRYDVARYEQEHLTPLDFGPKIRTHPTLKITANLKMGSAIQCSVSYAGRRLQTIRFRARDGDWLRGNLRATRSLLSHLSDKFVMEDGRVLFKQVPVDSIKAYLEEYEFHPDAISLSREHILGYIEAQNSRGRLCEWNVVVMTKSNVKGLGSVDIGCGEVNLINRSRFVPALKGIEDDADIKALMSPEDWKADHAGSLAEFRGKPASQLARGSDDPPCLAIYPISKDSVDSGRSKVRRPLNALEHVVGLGLMFPAAPDADDTPQRYMTVDLSSIEREELEIDELEDPDDADDSTQ